MEVLKWMQWQEDTGFTGYANEKHHFLHLSQQFWPSGRRKSNDALPLESAPKVQGLSSLTEEELGFFLSKITIGTFLESVSLSWKGCLEPFIHSLNVYLAPIMQQTWFKVLYDISLNKADKTPCSPKSLPYNERRQAISTTPGKRNQQPPSQSDRWRRFWHTRRGGT